MHAPRGDGAVDVLHVLHLHAAVFQPLQVLRRSVAERANKFFVHDVVAVEAHEVLVHHVRVVGVALLLLPRGTRREDLAAAAHGGTAGHAALFQQQHVRAGFLRSQRSGETRSARTHDHDVHVIGRVSSFLGNFLRLEDLGVAAGLVDSIGHSRDNGVSGHGRVGDSVHIQGLVGHDLAREHVNRSGGHAVAMAQRFRMTGDGHGLDGVGGEGHVHGDFAVLAGALAGVGAGGVSAVPGSRAGSLVKRLLHSGLDGVAGHGRAGDAVHLSGLRSGDRRNHRLARSRADARGIAGAIDRQSSDFAFRYGHSNLDGAGETLRLGLVGTRGVGGSHAEGRHDQRQREYEGHDGSLHHNNLLYSPRYRGRLLQH